MIEQVTTDARVLDHFELTCPKCQPTITFDGSLRQHIVEHIGAHILHDPSVGRSSEPCGLCLRPAPLCNIVLKKGKRGTSKLTINMQASKCPNLVKFSLAIAVKCSEASLCTNHPMRCPYCSNSSPAVWSYTFQQHLRHVHLKVPLDGHRSVWAMSKLEKDGMRRIWEHCLKQPKAHSRMQRMPLVISETHLSRLVLRYASQQFHSSAILIQKYLTVKQHQNQMRLMKAVLLTPTTIPTRNG